MSWWNNAPWADVSGEEGVPIGGLTGQVLAKKSDNERDVEWITVDGGEDGNSIVSVEKTNTVGLVDTYTITYTDIASTTFDVTNGEDGANGVKGDTGASIISAAFVSDDMVFTKDDDATVTITDAALTLKGETGETGSTGAGVAIGGSAGQVLSKVDGTNYNTAWIDPSGGLTQAQILGRMV